MLFIDLRKAFDTVNHDILINKLDHYGIRGSALKWFESYLSNRKQYVSINGVDSQLLNVTCGVPQGSVLGPLLFLLYINDLPNISNKLKFFLFADDTNIYLDSTDIRKLENILNSELSKLHEWLCINRLSLNVSKTNFVIFSPPNKPKTPVTILINKTAIKEEKYVKYLGILIDSQLTFRYHIEELKKKISRSIGVLCKLKPYVNAKLLTSVYYAIVYPFLLYGIPIWGNASYNLISSIYLLQKRFVRMATGNSIVDHHGTFIHTPPLFHKLNIMNIFDIYKLQIGLVIYESTNNIGPINSIINLPKADEIHQYNTRYANRGNLFINSVRTTRYGLKSISVEGAKLWATLPSYIKEKPSKLTFKSSLKKFLINTYISI